VLQLRLDRVREFRARLLELFLPAQVLQRRGAARVELVEERVLEPGDVASLPPPPQDIHAQQGLDGAPAYEFVLFGANTMLLPRLYFDPASDTAVEVQLGAR
jgi:hypothetical protein